MPTPPKDTFEAHFAPSDLEWLASLATVEHDALREEGNLQQAARAAKVRDQLVTVVRIARTVPGTSQGIGIVKVSTERGATQ